MQKSEQFIESRLPEIDTQYEVPLRPQTLADFLGQDEIRERLSIFIGAAKIRKEPLGHCLLSGPPGLGKTTLASIIAKAMNGNLVTTSGPLLEKPSDLAGILTNLQEGDVLFIDEIHRMHRTVEEYLYPAMEDYVLDIILDQGPHARSVQVKLNRFTLIGATTRSGLLTAPMRSRFGLSCRLDFYSVNLLEKILKRSAKILFLDINEEALTEVAKRSRGTPRIANHLLKWVRDYALIHPEKSVINRNLTMQALNLLAIDERGLDEMDKKILNTIIEYYGGGPVGINTIAVAVGEEAQTLEEVHEPFLILEGFLQRTPRGRMATEDAYKHLGKSR